MLAAFGVAAAGEPRRRRARDPAPRCVRTSEFLTHPAFTSHRSEHQMLRYLRRLADRDLALDRTMIPLGSCTMKLNATAEMEPITWPEFGRMHPYAPLDQAAATSSCSTISSAGSRRSPATTRCRCSRTPVRRASTRGCSRSASTTRRAASRARDVCLIPASAHGTNAASAAMAGMKVVVVACDDQRQRRPRRPEGEGGRARRPSSAR